MTDELHTDLERFLAAVAGDAASKCAELLEIAAKLSSELAKAESRVAAIEQAMIRTKTNQRRN